MAAVLSGKGRRWPPAGAHGRCHRLPTVRMAGLIVVLDGGRIVQQGGHDDLITRPGVYAELHAIQHDAFRS